MAYGTTLQKNLYYKSPLFIKNLVSSFYGFLQRRARYGEFYKKHFKFISESQWFSNEQLEEIQFNKTKGFLIYAKNHSKYYNNLLKKLNFQPEKITALTEINALPILEKTTVRKNIKDLISNDFKKYHVHWGQTSGTTGQSLIFPETADSFQREYAFRYLQYSWAKITQGEKFAFCAGHPVAYIDRKTPPFWVRDYANKWLLLSSYHLTEKNLYRYIYELEKFQPNLLQGYPSSLYLLALANQQFGNKIHPRAVATSSETLHDFQRAIIEKSFGCQVFDYYGNVERCGFIAQCEKGCYHLKLEHSYVEILDDNNQPASIGQEGKMICTGFGNSTLPFIRYLVGDVAILSKNEKCECGKGGRIIERIVGRTDDYILTPDGRFVGRLSQVLKGTNNVKLAQFIQNDVNEVVIKIVKEPRFNKKDEQIILDEAINRLGKEIKILFEYVKDIPRNKNGKYRYVVSNVGKKEIFNKII